MQQLRFVGPGDDGTVILQTDDGSEQYMLEVDDALRSVVHPVESAEPAPEVAANAESGGDAGGPPAALPLSPREIQIRVRAGEDPAAIAEETHNPLDKVMRFAVAVLAERSRVTDEARRARARRGSDGQLVPFGELADARFAAHQIDPAEVGWDAFRRADGGWTVVALLPESSNPAGVPVQAKFAFALGNRTVSALDHVAADVLSEQPIQALVAPVTPPPTPDVSADPPGSSGSAGNAAQDGWSDDDSTAGDDPEAPTGPRLAAVPSSVPPAVRPPSGRQRARTRPLTVANDDELFDQEAFEAEPAGDRDASAPTGWHEPQLPMELDLPTERIDPVEPAAAPVEPVNAESAAGGPEAAPPTDADDKPNKRGHRPSDKPRMPSWDDILLGVRRRTE